MSNIIYNKINELVDRYSLIRYYNIRNTIFDEEEFELEIEIKKEFVKAYSLNDNKYFFEIFENELKLFDRNFMMKDFLNKYDEVKFEKIKFLFSILMKINKPKLNQILKKYDYKWEEWKNQL